MRIEIGIQPNCSECAIVVYPDKLTISQKQLFAQFCTKNKLETKRTKKNNYVIELNEEEFPICTEDILKIANNLEMISAWVDNKIERKLHFDLIRDECYEEMLENGTI